LPYGNNVSVGSTFCYKEAMNKAHILIVEDEKDIRDLISFQLQSTGHLVTAVESAESALSFIESDGPVALFIVDWMLPGPMSGLELTKRLRSHPQYKTTPII